MVRTHEGEALEMYEPVMPRLVCCFCLGAALLLTSAASAQELVLDDFEDIAGWKPVFSEGVSLDLKPGSGHSGRCLRLDFDFTAGTGYAVAQKSLPVRLPDDYRFTFRLRWDAPVNNFEFKLVDPAGNVWWRKEQDVEYGRDWQQVAIRKRHISFAWGPGGSGRIRNVAEIEFAVTASQGGRGSIYIDDLRLEPIAVAGGPQRPPTATASSSREDTPPERAIDGDPETAWFSGPGGQQWFLFDLGQFVEFGGLVIDWAAGGEARDYDVAIAEADGSFRTASSVRQGNGGRDYVYLGESESRFVKLELRGGGGQGYGIRALATMSLAEASTPNKFFETIARGSPPGHFPKYFRNEQTYWTVAGASGDAKEALLNEEGALEVDKASFTLEPFLWLDGRLVTWHDVIRRQALADGYLPIPSVIWQHPAFALGISAVARGEPGAASLVAIYNLRNTTANTLRGRFFLTIRPFQVLPPWQSLNFVGGVAKIREIARAEDVVSVNGSPALVPLVPPQRFAAVARDEGDITEYLAQGEIPQRGRVTDDKGLASAALAYDVALEPGQELELIFEVPWYGVRQLERAAPGEAAGRSPKLLAAAAASWREALQRVELQLPASALSLVQTFKSSLAYILVLRDGPAIQGGARTYDRAWIRDASYTASALLRTGHADEVREFLEWYGAYQYPNGKIPCVVDQRGPDPVAEHDSPGQFVYIVAEYYRFTKDDAFLRRIFPKVVKAVEYIRSLHEQRLTEEYRSGSPEQRACYGLVPESISHEGYSAKPMHSYWDDFYIIKGLKDAVVVAQALGETGHAQRCAPYRDEAQRNLYASIRQAAANRGIDYIPGCVELGDFDATSTAIGIFPCGELDSLPQPLLRNTFEKYYTRFLDRRDGKLDWKDYTPYELRIINYFLFTGEKERALALLSYFLADRRPPAWNHWAEVVWREPQEPKFIGDMPHLSMSADFINIVRNMFVYEREDDGALVLGAGIPEEWLSEPEGVTIRGFPTYVGVLSLSLRGAEDRVSANIEIKDKSAPVKTVLRSPRRSPIKHVEVEGARMSGFTATEIMLDDVPSRVVISY